MTLGWDHRITKVEARRAYNAARSPGCCVYLIFARDDKGPMYIKVGISATPALRANGVQTGCPIKIKRVIAFTCGDRRDAREAELALHAALAPYQSSGEWFRFKWGVRDKRTLEKLLDAVMITANGEDLREITPDMAKSEKVHRENTWEAAQIAAEHTAYNKYRMNVELRTPVPPR